MTLEKRRGLKNKTAVILAGGESRRFGSNKAFAKIDGRTFLERLATTLDSLGFEFFLSVSDPQIYKHLSLKIIPDLFPKEGPLQALYSAFLHLNTPRILLLACDMPLVTPEVIKELWRQSENVDICLQESSPLPGVYSRNVLPSAKYFLEEGRRDLKSLLESHLKKGTVSSDEISHVNINSKEEWRQALSIFSRREQESKCRWPAKESEKSKASSSSPSVKNYRSW